MRLQCGGIASTTARTSAGRPVRAAMRCTSSAASSGRDRNRPSRRRSPGRWPAPGAGRAGLVGGVMRQRASQQRQRLPVEDHAGEVEDDAHRPRRTQAATTDSPCPASDSQAACARLPARLHVGRDDEDRAQLGGQRHFVEAAEVGASSAPCRPAPRPRRRAELPGLGPHRHLHRPGRPAPARGMQRQRAEAHRAVGQRLGRRTACASPMKPATNSLAGLLVQLLRRAGLGDAAGVHHDDLVADRQRLALVVRDVGHGQLQALLQRADLLAHAAAQPRVEVGQRLVEQQHRGSSTSARATATRCCWPPESSLGQARRRSRPGRRCPSSRGRAASRLVAGSRPARRGRSRRCRARSCAGTARSSGTPC